MFSKKKINETFGKTEHADVNYTLFKGMYRKIQAV